MHVLLRFVPYAGDRLDLDFEGDVMLQLFPLFCIK